jgi:uncharacterized protein YjbI with pentapeptide repeats
MFNGDDLISWRSMADLAQLDLIKNGVAEWNEWMDKNYGVLVQLQGADLSEAELSHANLRDAYLSHANLSETNLSHADLSDTDLSGANLRSADLSGANLADANLVGTDLSNARLNGVTLRYARLFGAKLAGARLYGAKLYHARLDGADFTDADLEGADFTSASLSNANFTRAQLHNVKFAETALNGADLTGAKITGTIFANTNLREARGLELCSHRGPSSIGIETFFKSNGEIPEIFLRGCGVPEQFITYGRSLVGKAIEFYSCFISYSTKDQEFADRLHADLQNNAVRCWFAPHDIQGGRKVHEQIDEAIRVYDRLLLILSEHSMNSNWVKTEISKARKRESREKRQMLFPVRVVSFDTLRDWECFDADTGKDSAREIREYHIPDFSNWKDHNSYKAAFDRLLRDLKAKADTPGR